MKSNIKLVLIVIAVIIAVTVAGIFAVQSSQNRAISLEESVYTASSDVEVQEKRRVDLVYNLADCVKQYDAHESKTLTELAENMSKGNDVENVSTSIAAITYSYPDLKSNKTYIQLMDELSITENLIAQSRENYNKSVGTYNKYVNKFPTRIFLNWTGYDEKEFERLEFNAPSDAPQNLFGE